MLTAPFGGMSRFYFGPEGTRARPTDYAQPIDLSFDPQIFSWLFQKKQSHDPNQITESDLETSGTHASSGSSAMSDHDNPLERSELQDVLGGESNPCNWLTVPDLLRLQLCGAQLREAALRPDVWENQCRTLVKTLDWVGPVATLGLEERAENMLLMTPRGLQLRDVTSAAFSFEDLQHLGCLLYSQPPAMARSSYSSPGYHLKELNLNGERHGCTVAAGSPVVLDTVMCVFNQRSHLTARSQVVLGVVKLHTDGRQELLHKFCLYSGVPWKPEGNAVTVQTTLELLEAGEYVLRLHFDQTYFTETDSQEFDCTERHNAAFITVV